jgi:hypothetical protein
MHGADWAALLLLGNQADAVVTRLADVPVAIARIGREREGEN